MKRNTDEGTWEFEVRDGLAIAAIRHVRTGTGEEVIASLGYDPEAPTLVWRVRSYEHRVVGDVAPSSPPLEAIERFANQPNNALMLSDRRDAPALRLMPMLLHGAQRRGRKPDRFYGMVLIYKRACEQFGEPFAPRIADDNGVKASVVYRWVAEAKRRGITIDDDEVGQVRIRGEAMDTSGEPAEAGAPMRTAR